MTSDERNEVWEVLDMIGTASELIVNRAEKTINDCLDKHIYHTELKSNCQNNAKDILEIAKSIEKRMGPVLLMIEEQREGLKGNDIDE